MDAPTTMNEQVVGSRFQTDVNLAEAVGAYLRGKVFTLPSGVRLEFPSDLKVTTDRQRQLLLFSPKPRVEAKVGMWIFTTNVETTVSGVRLGLDETMILIDGYPDHKVVLGW